MHFESQIDLLYVPIWIEAPLYSSTSVMATTIAIDWYCFWFKWISLIDFPISIGIYSSDEWVFLLFLPSTLKWWLYWLPHSISPTPMSLHSHKCTPKSALRLFSAVSRPFPPFLPFSSKHSHYTVEATTITTIGQTEETIVERPMRNAS